MNPDPDRNKTEYRLLKRVDKVCDALKKELGHEPSMDVFEEATEIARRVNCSVQRLKEVLAWRSIHHPESEDAIEPRKNPTNRIADEDSEDGGEDDDDDDELLDGVLLSG